MMEPITWEILIVAIVGIVSFFSSVTAIVTSIISTKSNSKKASQSEVESLTTMQVDIKYIKKSVDKFGELPDRVTAVEASTKQAHKRIDSLEQRTN